MGCGLQKDQCHGRQREVVEVFQMKGNERWEANAVPALHLVAMLEEKKPLQRALIGQLTNLE